jgi:putative hemolysin
MRETKEHSGFRLNGVVPLRSFPRLSRLIDSGIERAFALEQLEHIYRGLPAGRGPADFLVHALAAFGVSTQLAQGEAERVPATGSVIAVANQPFGAIEALLLTHVLLQRRLDVRVLASHFLQRVPELSELFFPVDASAGGQQIHANASSVRKALRWVAQGGLLLVFPAATAAHLHLSRGRVTDPPWSPSIGRIVALTGAAVLPVYVHGANGAMFQLAGMLHPQLRTALLPRELMNKTHTSLRLRIGRPIAHAHLRRVGSDEAIVRYLRMRTYLLGALDASGDTPAASRPSASATPAPIVPAGTADALAAEIESLPPDCSLVTSGAFRVLCARAAEIPRCLEEIGRLREITFRAVGEGTGRGCDLDTFDSHYLHLFVWNTEKREVVGAYRLGLADEILERHGKRGLYTNTLFRYRGQALRSINPALELGRSFVRAEYQRSFSPLLLLWRGVGQFIVRNPRYAVLFGAVSISSHYAQLSRQLIVDFLKLHRIDPALARYVKPRRPFRGRRLALADEIDPLQLCDLEGLSHLLAQIESDGKGVPILLKQYLKLGGRLLGFNLDDQFADALDGLVVVDLRATDAGVLAKYMGEAGARTFLDYHAARAQRPQHVDI